MNVVFIHFVQIKHNRLLLTKQIRMFNYYLEIVELLHRFAPRSIKILFNLKFIFFCLSSLWHWVQYLNLYIVFLIGTFLDVQQIIIIFFFLVKPKIIVPDNKCSKMVSFSWKKYRTIRALGSYYSNFINLDKCLILLTVIRYTNSGEQTFSTHRL